MLCVKYSIDNRRAWQEEAGLAVTHKPIGKNGKRRANREELGTEGAKALQKKYDEVFHTQDVMSNHLNHKY